MRRSPASARPVRPALRPPPRAPAPAAAAGRRRRPRDARRRRRRTRAARVAARPASAKPAARQLARGGDRGAAEAVDGGVEVKFVPERLRIPSTGSRAGASSPSAKGARNTPRIAARSRTACDGPSPPLRRQPEAPRRRRGLDSARSAPRRRRRTSALNARSTGPVRRRRLEPAVVVGRRPLAHGAGGRQLAQARRRVTKLGARVPHPATVKLSQDERELSWTSRRRRRRCGRWRFRRDGGGRPRVARLQAPRARAAQRGPAERGGAAPIVLAAAALDAAAAAGQRCSTFRSRRRARRRRCARSARRST